MESDKESEFRRFFTRYRAKSGAYSVVDGEWFPQLTIKRPDSR